MVVVLSCEVSAIVMVVLSPGFRLMAGDAVPLETVVPLTLIVADAA